MLNLSDRERLHRQAGFTLVEMLVTVLVLGLSVAGIAGLYYSMQITQARSQHMDLATRAARTEIEQLRNNGYSQLVAGSTLDFTGKLPDQLPSDKHGEVLITEPISGLKRVDVTVSYSDFGKNQKVTLSSNIGIIGIGGQ